MPILVLCALALSLRFIRLGSTELWFDEAYSAFLIHFSPTDILTRVRNETSPPLYYLLLGFWADLWGRSEISLRALSAIAGTVAVVIQYAIGRVVSRKAGLIAGAATAITPIAVYYSREARMYALAVAAISFTILCLVKALSESNPKTIFWWAGFSVSSAIAVWLHYFSAFAVAAALLVVVGMGWRAWWTASAALLAAGIATLPLLPWALEQVRLPATTWIDRIVGDSSPFGLPLRSLEIFTPGALYPSYVQFQFGSPLWRPLVVVILSVALFHALVAAFRGGLHERLVARTGLFFLMMPLVLMSAVSAFRPIYLLGRYDLVALPGFMVAVGVGIGRLRRGSTAVVACGAILLTVHSLTPLYEQQPGQASLARAVGERLSPLLGSRDVLIFTGYSAPEVLYPLLREGRQPRYVTMPLSGARHLGWVDNGPLSDPILRRQEAARVARRAVREAEGHVVWLIADDRLPGPQEVVDGLQSLGRRAVRVIDLVDGTPVRGRQPMTAIPFIPESPLPVGLGASSPR